MLAVQVLVWQAKLTLASAISTPSNSTQAYRGSSGCTATAVFPKTLANCRTETQRTQPEPSLPGVLWVHRHGCIAQHGLHAGGGHHNLACMGSEVRKKRSG